MDYRSGSTARFTQRNKLWPLTQQEGKPLLIGNYRNPREVREKRRRCNRKRSGMR